MAFKEKYYPYDSVIVLGDTNENLKLSINSKNKDIPLVNVQSSKSKYSTIAIPYTFFADLYESRLTTKTHFCEDLQEELTMTREGFTWVVVQSWEGEDHVTTNILHKDMLQMMQHCSRTLQIRNTYKKARPWYKKVYKNIIKIYNIPRKLINW